MLLQTEKEQVVKELLNEVMVRMQKQLLVPATYTLKQNKDAEADVHVFLHGSLSSHLSNTDLIWGIVSPFEEKIRQVNALTDYYLGFFIAALKKETEYEAIGEVVANLDFLYDQKVQATLWLDEDKGQDMVTFTPMNPEYEITLTMDQLEQEYNSRFINDENIDILADLADLTKCFKTQGLEETVKLAEKFGRNITVK